LVEFIVIVIHHGLLLRLQQEVSVIEGILSGDQITVVPKKNTGRRWHAEEKGKRERDTGFTDRTQGSLDTSRDP
jgi:hypothetical protein